MWTWKKIYVVAAVVARWQNSAKSAPKSSSNYRSVAKIFEKLGGEVKYFGKPYPEVYEKAFKNLQGKKVICIGDNLNTDIKGANMQNFDSLLINNGIHKNEMSNGIKELTKKYNVNVNYTQTELKW